VEPVPVQRGAISPQDRRRHALVPVLVRLLAVAGFAFAGWFALSALTESAFAAERPQPAVRLDGSALVGSALSDHAASESARNGSALGGSSTLGHFAPGRDSRSGGPAGQVSRDLSEIGDRPIGYLESRRQDVFADKDRAVRDVRDLAGAAGVPQVGLPDVRADRPVIRVLVRPVTDPGHGLLPGAHEKQDARAGAAHAAPEATSAAHSRHATVAPRTFAATTAEHHAGHCPGCRGDGRAPAPGPALPSGQDGPGTGGSGGGHPFAPVADLASGRYPAAPPAVTTGTFRRTALTDLAAPGGPSVVPD
jgi:hypothetical protein